MTAHLVEPIALGAADDVVLAERRTWTRAEVRHTASALTTRWMALPAFDTAPLVALRATSTAESVLALWTLIELGVPFVPLHPAWSEIHCRQVLAETSALLLSNAPAPSLSHKSDAPPSPLRQRPLPESPLAVVFTSGSTGAPKGVVLSHRAFAASAKAAQAHLDLRSEDIYLLSLPLAHVGGLSIVTRAAVLGGTVALPSTNAARSGFDAEQFVSDCARTRSTVVSLVPTQLRRICVAGLRAPDSVRRVLVGGAHPPPQLVQTALDLGWPVHRTYGLTEACSQVATDRTPGASGPLELLTHVEARLETDGRLALRGPALFSGYWGHPPRSVDDWFVTSDLARLGANGVTPLGRADDVVISGGENIDPEEVDVALGAAPGVAAACSFGRESSEWGHELCAAVVASPDFDPARLVAHLRGVLPSFKIPKVWVLVPELPMTATGKLSRRLCRQTYATRCRPFP